MGLLSESTGTMEIRCGWCDAYMGTKPGNGGPTHSMCSTCKAKWDQQVAEKKRAKGGK